MNSKSQILLRVGLILNGTFPDFKVSLSGVHAMRKAVERLLKFATTSLPSLELDVMSVHVEDVKRSCEAILTKHLLSP